jgi:catechol 2,3-dioxygenase-like lactoylglutathione lyase family enzyme/predicted enzyme related to lactoylglutathione lyase
MIWKLSKHMPRRMDGEDSTIMAGTRRNQMKKLILILGLAMLFPARASWAQVAKGNDAGVSMGHVHFLVPDVEAAKTFWTAMGGVPGKLGPNDVFKFPGVLILVRKGDGTTPTVGSVVGHIGFHVPDTTAALARWKAAGLNTEVGQNPGQGFVWTPDKLLRVEILEDKTQTVPIAFHHVHFYIAESAGSSNVLEMQSWYVKMFGAKPGKRGQFDAADIPGANLTFTKSDTPTVGTKGRMLDHIGFEIVGLEAFCKKAEANGLKFDMPYTKRPDLGIALAFITDPWGTYIELNEGLDKM